jgi:hypothetical protein
MILTRSGLRGLQRLGKAAGPAIANVQGYHADLTVTLDLRSLPSG